MSPNDNIVLEVDYLFDRWQDERDYEEFDDYILRAKSVVEKAGGKFIHLQEHPFVLKYEKDERILEVKRTSKELTITEINHKPN